ncbi:MAG: hypothetical protein CVU13_11220 [Bacteroidetes bacterium HGW-Bacteroidetes-8]|jgi:hypothetical protein|nr:MAG: hypothetical protein CVU13_11220 [Bacteroidetes bacterium HGW-Bacteroidetes-8]
MKRSFLIAISLVISLTSHSQSGTIKVFNGKVVEGDFFKEKLYVFDKYVNGRIRLSDGTVYVGDLNINTLGQTVRVITDTRDTIAIKTEKLVEAVSAGNTLFLKLNNTYVQVLNTAGDTYLGISRVLKLGQEKIEGAYGGTNEVSSIAKYSSVEVENRLEKIVGSSNIRYDYYENIHLIKGGKLIPATKKNFEKLFSDQKKMIESYIEENNIKFNHNESVIQLFNYLANSL